MKIVPIFCVFLIVNTMAVIISHAAESTAPDPARIKFYENILPASPRGVGAPIGDRQAWDELVKLPAAAKLIAEAERLLKKPIAEFTDEMYLDYSRTGNRTRFQAAVNERHGRLCKLVLTECLENRGRFLPAIEEAIAAVCTEKTWVWPAHDVNMRNFKGEEIEIDLNAANVAWNLATIDYWLGDKLKPGVRKEIADELERRTFTPFTKMVETGKPRMWWLTITNNWNAVCLADVTGTAFTMIESRARRAFFAASAEKYIENFLKGFTPDGYCSEGIGYWNYGFGHFIMLAETIRQATEGKVDMLAAEHIKPIALYPRRMEILPGVYPAFADGQIGGKPDAILMAFLSRRMGFGWKDIEKASDESQLLSRIRLYELGIFGFHNLSKTEDILKTERKESNASQPLRDLFADAGILICRPKPGNAHALGVALKGGHNAENHNHNDVGSFVVALGNSTPLLDPGSEVYTARTFSGDRYKSNVINSFGHPVPRVADTLQITGRSAQAKILKTLFTDSTDTFVIDISSAYKVEGLKKLVQTFVFSREGNGKLTVTDEVEFDHAQKLGTALITFVKWKKAAPDRLEIGEGTETVEAVVTSTGGGIQFMAEEIKEDLANKKYPTRLGIDLDKPVLKGSVTVTITPK